MDKCTHEVRLQYWKNIISQCWARPTGQTVRQWMKENSICEKTYYLWQRRIRQETYEQMSAPSEMVPVALKKKEITFAEIPFQSASNSSDTQSADTGITPVAVIKISTCQIAVSGDIPESY